MPVGQEAVGRAFSQPCFGVLTVVELHVHLIGDRGGHVVVNHTRQTRSTIGEDIQRQGAAFVFHKHVAQAVCLGTQAVNANRSVGTRSFRSDHVVGRVSQQAVVEGTHQNVVGAGVCSREFRIASCGEILRTFH